MPHHHHLHASMSQSPSPLSCLGRFLAATRGPPQGHQRFRIRNAFYERRHKDARETLEYAIVGRHLGFCCDLCGKTDFAGRRYKCTQCFDYDLCSDCHGEGRGPPRHTGSIMSATLFLYCSPPPPLPDGCLPHVSCSERERLVVQPPLPLQPPRVEEGGLHGPPAVARDAGQQQQPVAHRSPVPGPGHAVQESGPVVHACMLTCGLRHVWVQVIPSIPFNLDLGQQQPQHKA